MIFKKGKLNKITDVTGIRVGHKTLADGDIQTGVTVILPHSGNIFKEKLIAGAFVINGFGKTTGLMQINELGTIETPIVLTNTLSVGTAYSALVKYMLSQNKDIGETTGSVNPIICECNDSVLNDIRSLAVKEEVVFEAINNACQDFECGSLGAGRGMVCHQLKGGIGSSSRIIKIEEKEYTLGTLVLSNHSILEELIINGKPIGKELASKLFKNEPADKLFEDELTDKKNEEEKGSIITIIATDIPLSLRQLTRLCKRVPLGLAMTGAYCGNGSGEIAIAFSTANKVFHYPANAVNDYSFLSDTKIDLIFRALKSSVEESVLNSLFSSHTVKGKRGKIVKAIEI